MAAARFASANELKIPTTLSMIQSSPKKLLALSVPQSLPFHGVTVSQWKDHYNAISEIALLFESRDVSGRAIHEIH
jgi:hypothetical protein